MPDGIRPTSEVVREAVFDVLGSVEGDAVLDLFAGTGALGLEALSRGAASCAFVELRPRVRQALEQNILSLGFADVAEIVAAGYLPAARRMLAHGAVFDLLFADPPYRMLPEVEQALTPLVGRLLSEGGLAVIEGPKTEKPRMGLVPVFERPYGDTLITILEKATEQI